MSSIIFAIHPIHTEAVSGIVGRADILAAIFFLLSWLAFQTSQIRSKSGQNPEKFGQNPEKSGQNPEKSGQKLDFYMMLTILSAAIAMFSKEQGITILGIILIDTFLKRVKKGQKGQKCQKGSGGTLTFIIVSILALLAIRGRIMGFSPPKFAKADNPSSNSDCIFTRFRTLAFLPAFNFWLMICPSQLSFDWSMDAVPLIKSWWDHRNILSAFFYAGILALAYKSRKVRTIQYSNIHIHIVL